MNLLPPPGPQRTRLIALIILVVVMAPLAYKYAFPAPPVIPTSTGPAPTAVPKRVQQPVRSQSGVPRKPGSAATTNQDPSIPQALKLAEMEQVPDEPSVSRNPFRFGVPPPPPPPPYVPPPPQPPPPPPPPPPAPQVQLKLTTIIVDPLRTAQPRAYLTDPKTGYTLEGVEGQVLDGRYKLLKVGTQSVVISFVDGTGQRTLTIGG